ncbi:MarR family winged helix-turn-helix transcriptional regulator [Paracoccus zhejiangensis]|uniref:MarR family transcriptional regulator n=1 Tax=Paracoccus zhejiangensis TaxID=1077935 RepID=A0A2H5F563_9RHOB|nr:MarR family transcriptional regulator [Paracoccus zhejiangensis]AUH66674.1 MarR family transcriptional regulator [Paracoccus zhejiangensis]
MESPPLLDSFLRAMRELRVHYDASAAEIGLTMSRARVISALARQEGATQAELAACLNIEAPTLKRQVDALETQGFLKRRGMDGDARKRALFLTEKGRAARISRFMENIRGQVLDGISPEEQVQLAVLLERVAENAAKLNR